MVTVCLLKIGTSFFTRKAKLLLRKKKFQESQLEKMDGQLDNIEKMVSIRRYSGRKRFAES